MKDAPGRAERDWGSVGANQGEPPREMPSPDPSEAIPMTLRDAIRAFAEQNKVFSAAEAKETHGPSAPVILCQMARDGQLTRLKTGVYALPEYATERTAHEEFLARKFQQFLERASNPRANTTDRLLAWASKRTDFTAADASRYIGRNVKGLVQALRVRGQLEKIETGRYRFRSATPEPKPNATGHNASGSEETDHKP